MIGSRCSEEKSVEGSSRMEVMGENASRGRKRLRVVVGFMKSECIALLLINYSTYHQVWVLIVT